MRRFKKLLCIVVAIVTLSSMLMAEACTVMAVGKDATEDGSTLVTHSCDGWYDHRIQIVEGGKHAEGDMVDIYRDPCMDTLETPVKVGEIPQVAETYTYFNIAYPFMNEKGVAIGEHTWGGKSDLFNGDQALFVIANLEMLGLQRAATAKEVVQTMGALAEQYGYADWGECLLVADKDEVWIFEIIGPGPLWTPESGDPGAHWAARRVPDDEYFTAANRSRMGVIDFNDTENFMWSTDITKLPETMGWWKEGEEFNFTDIFDALQEDMSYGCSGREWRVFSLLTPSSDLEIHNGSQPYPWSMKPDEKLTAQDLMEVYTDHYEGTPYDTTVGLAAGPFGCPVRYRVKRDQRPEEVAGFDWPRVIGIYRCSYSFVAELRPDMPGEIGTCLWFGEDDPTTTVHVPLYAGTTRVPEEWSTGDRKHFDGDSAWWAFNFVNNWACLRWDMMYEEIDAKRDEIEGKFFEQQDAVEAEALKLYESDPDAAKEYLTEYVCENMDYVNETWWEFAGYLVGKYSDGQVTTDDGYSSPGYPTEYLEAVGYGQDQLADYKAFAGIVDEPEEPAEPEPQPEPAPEPEPEPAPAPEAPAETNSGMGTGVVIGLIIGAAVAAIAVYFSMKKKK